MKTRLLIFFAFVGFPSLMSTSFADCNVNDDWPEAPCMDEIVNNHFLQYQVDKWAEYYDYKGSQFMESKNIEMNNAIKSNGLLEWVDESTQNENVWRYYYFSGQATNPYQYLQNVEFEPIPSVNYVDFRNAEGKIICKGYSSGGGFFEYPECGPIDQFVIHVLIIVLPVAGITSSFVIWRTRK